MYLVHNHLCAVQNWKAFYCYNKEVKHFNLQYFMLNFLQRSEFFEKKYTNSSLKYT